MCPPRGFFGGDVERRHQARARRRRGRRPPPARPPPSHPTCGLGSQSAACWAGDIDCDAYEAAARARDAEAFKGGMTVKEINAAFGERAGELKKPAKRLGLIDMGLIHLFMM